MNAAVITAEFLTAPEAAALLRVEAEKVRDWIEAGELRASNVATKRGGRPQWRIRRVDLDTFLDSRLGGVTVKATRRTAARKKDANFVRYF